MATQNWGSDFWNNKLWTIVSSHTLIGWYVNSSLSEFKSSIDGWLLADFRWIVDPFFIISSHFPSWTQLLVDCAQEILRLLVDCHYSFCFCSHPPQKGGDRQPTNHLVVEAPIPSILRTCWHWYAGQGREGILIILGTTNLTNSEGVVDSSCLLSNCIPPYIILSEWGGYIQPPPQVSMNATHNLYQVLITAAWGSSHLVAGSQGCKLRMASPW